MKNYYFDDLVKEGGVCVKCKNGTYSTSGSVGASSCVKSKPCTEDDYSFSYLDCDFEKN